MHVKIIGLAEIELDDAFDYYEYELPGLGHKFLAEFRKGVNRILANPHAWSPVQDNIRKCILRKFPFNIIYAVEDDVIIILAIAHQRRNPNYWIGRVEKR